MENLKMGYGEDCQARRGTVAVDRSVSHTALHPLSRPPPARDSTRAPPACPLSTDTTGDAAN